MNIKFSDRIAKPDFQGDFTAQILQAAADPSIISFAGGLPNPVAFPVKAMEEATNKVFAEKGIMALQYNGAQGYLPLRQFICDRYKKTAGLDFDPSEILITNGSQQCLEMMGAVLLNEGDEIIVENPTYLVALQSFHLYNPTVLTVDLNKDGMDCEQLEKTIAEHDPKFMYVIPNFQNPTGLTYTPAVREKVAEIIKKSNVMVFEDNPYGELRFSGEAGKSFGYYLGEQACLMGSFSKIVAPGMRLGWIACKNKELFQKFLNYKCTVDLHTNIFCQIILTEFLAANDLDAHIAKTKELYKAKAEYMIACLKKYMPAGVEVTNPEGGMFMWATLPEGLRAVDVYYEAIKKGVAFCPGDPFYEKERGVRTMRLNYSNSTDEVIEKGVKILADVIKSMM